MQLNDNAKTNIKKILILSEMYKTQKYFGDRDTTKHILNMLFNYNYLKNNKYNIKMYVNFEYQTIDKHFLINYLLNNVRDFHPKKKINELKLIKKNYVLDSINLNDCSRYDSQSEIEHFINDFYQNNYKKWDLYKIGKKFNWKFFSKFPNHFDTKGNEEYSLIFKKF